MFLEAQFGPSLTPIVKPQIKLPTSDSDDVKTESDDEVSLDALAEAEADELARLHSLGIPVPGIEVKVDHYIAKIWLETLEVECPSRVFAQRVKSVVDRAVEIVAPLWSTTSKGSTGTMV